MHAARPMSVGAGGAAGSSGEGGGGAGRSNADAAPRTPTKTANKVCSMCLSESWIGRDDLSPVTVAKLDYI